MAINGATELYGIMGNPVSHSLSPAMHNSAFAALGLNKAYLPFVVQDVAQAMTGFRALGIKGVSVTIPHKQAVMQYLDSIDPVAEKIGAVNTLLIDQGAIHGANTDWLGANRALSEKIPLKGASVLLLGAGGSARAIGFGLLEAGASITIASRTPEKGQGLAALLGCPWLPLADAAGATGNILVNATSLGMAPQQEQLPIVSEALINFKVVMDIVYAPLETRLLQAAKQAGCQTIDGLAMLLYQGAAQFELWTGRQAPVAVMRQSLLTSLGYNP
ncbi:shikimate dehydrogenase [Thiovibrio frasassiensis]|uniref:Shikimate dehydrogenase (NADP(+)) n=1 Tax=Thiovibrio frasassiensis TaxID=2984131 RepID=A0A9X4MF17_9BACT|nr:shikimate dehydrogenase [Thiovibrio frasassiensis]MDG4475106.1 shikimate dehydrogenase [Thiovibrio frasassiensis]